MQFKPLQREDKSELVSTHSFTRYASKRYITNYQIYFGTINAVLMRFEEKKTIILISKWGALIYMLQKSKTSILR